jgi:hypothetical protein
MSSNSLLMPLATGHRRGSLRLAAALFAARVFAWMPVAPFVAVPDVLILASASGKIRRLGSARLGSARLGFDFGQGPPHPPIDSPTRAKIPARRQLSTASLTCGAAHT